MSRVMKGMEGTDNPKEAKSKHDQKITTGGGGQNGDGWDRCQGHEDWE
jgi:hypothetical protein